MRLATLRVSGFKSFAEPVTLRFSVGVTGMVGPNGCGKSNLVDALRWTLGESRASSLRGEALSDVLFKGGGGLPAAAICSVELRFVNDGGRDLGIWKECAEIVVRRQFDSEGASSYSINGQGARRRDVADLFHGTGVSSRAYGVVEQGMIGHLVDASPEQLRAFLEEAADVSRYRERRRESERRLARSRDNLARISELARESEKRLAALRRQSRAAQRHLECTRRINERHAILLSRRLAAADARLRARAAEIDESQKAAEAARARGAQAEAEAAKARKDEAAAAEAAARAREVLAQSAEKRTAGRRELDFIDETRARFARQSQSDREELAAAEKEALAGATTKETIAAADESARQKRAQADKDLQGASAAQTAAEAAQTAAQTAAEAAREELSKIEREIEREKTRAQLRGEEAARLQSEIETAATALARPPEEESDDGERERLEARRREAEEAEEKTRAAANALAAARQAHDENEREARAAADAEKAAAAKREGLTALARDGRGEKWPRDESSSAPPRLAEATRLRAGKWARALDASLGRRATAVVVDSLEEVLQKHGRPPPGTALIELPPAENNSPAQNEAPADSLLAALQAENASPLPPRAQATLARWLSGVRAVADDQAARGLRAGLGANEAAATADGDLYFADGAFFYGETAGGYAWEARLEAADSEIAALAATRARLESLREQSGLDLTRREADNALAAKAAEEARAAAREAAALDGAAQKRREAARRLGEERQAALAELRRRLESCESERREAGANLERGQDAAARARDNREQAKARLQERAESLQDKRGESLRAAATKAEAERELAEQKRRGDELRARGDELRARIERLRARIERTEREASGLDAARLEEEAQKNEDRLAQNRAHSEAAEAALRDARARTQEWETARGGAHRDAETAQSALAERRVAAQAEKMERARAADALDEIGIEAQADDAQIDDAAIESEIEELRAKRERLGAINFAAAEEIEEANRQSEALAAQIADIEAAVVALQESIVDLNRETRGRLREVFTGVNREFDSLFKQMFGGGAAKIEIDGDSVLESTLSIRARPPGKRELPMRSLSGGERAACALSLIFAIFRLNPPPFCLLDEVDAALDDSRALLFSRLLKTMAQSTQIVVVSHNKITIENADTLLGVTQEEKGVSKVVTVDVARALAAVGGAGG